MTVLIDTCIVVDVLQKREPFYKEAMDIFLAASNRQFYGILTAKSITDIYYILRRSIQDEQHVRKLLHMLFVLFTVEDTFSTDCQLALGSPMKDYEDAIMVQTAKRSGAAYIITRNIKDFALSDVPVYSPEEFLQKLQSESN